MLHFRELGVLIVPFGEPWASLLPGHGHSEILNEKEICLSFGKWKNEKGRGDTVEDMLVNFNMIQVDQF